MTDAQDDPVTVQVAPDVHTPPPAPNPSSDPALEIRARERQNDPAVDADARCRYGNDDDDDAGPKLSTLSPSEALKLLSSSVELLVRMTGDVPPTPPLKTPTNPQMSDMQNEKVNIARSHSERSLAKMRERERVADELRRQQQAPRDSTQPPADKMEQYKAAMRAQLLAQQQQAAAAAPCTSCDNTSMTIVEPIDGVKLRKDSQFSPPSSADSHSELKPYIIVGADSQPLNMQHGAITRKFYSKNEPPITIGQYLLRLHQFCPMSTAVYLATSLYIHRLAVEERAIPVTRRNAHRLVLAGLRVAMKALEDLSYPHGKMAKVGGVSEAELARLEISFCFLAGFELVVREESLRQHWEVLRRGKAEDALVRMRDGLGELRIPTRKKTSVQA